MKHHIFIIDDDRDELFIFEEAFALLKSNIKCTYAENAEHAMQMLDHPVPDFIFLDMNMPKIDGFECLRMIRKRTYLSKSRVIMFSTGMTELLCEKAKRLGAFDCYKKEEDIYKLTDQISHILQTVDTV